MKDFDNYDYLRGFADGHGINQDCVDKDDFPEGINSYDEVVNRMYELKESRITIVNIEVGTTKLPFQSKAKFELSNGEYIMFPFPNNLTLKDWEKL